MVLLGCCNATLLCHGQIALGFLLCVQFGETERAERYRHGLFSPVQIDVGLIVARQRSVCAGLAGAVIEPFEFFAFFGKIVRMIKF